MPTFQPPSACALIPSSSATMLSRMIESHATSPSAGLTGRYHERISEIDREAWDMLFGVSAEGFDYFNAIEQTTSEAFTYGAIAVYAGRTLVAAAPMFSIDYRLDTSLGENLKSLTTWIAQSFPMAFRVPVMGLGSPMTEECPIGIAPGLSPQHRLQALGQLLATLQEAAAARGARVLALKDVTDSDAHWMHEVLGAAGYARMASLPVATLALPYAHEDGYLASLTPKVRTDLRRKMRLAKDVTIEFRDDIGDIHDELVALYQETRANRKASYEAFDEIPEGYFREVMHHCPSARIMLCRVDGKIASFNLFFEEPGRVIGKFIGMNYALARQHNLYFVNWMSMVRYCIERGIGELQTGQTTYQLKMRLGCTLKRSWVYFRHRNSALNAVFHAVGPRVGLDKADPDLKALGDKAVYRVDAV